MLLTWDVTSATGAKNYYASSVSPGTELTRQDYYSEGQESPGKYGGKLGEMLGLNGKVVDKATFDRLCDNLHPTEDGSLTPRTNEFRRVCKDLTFSGPKSFSIIEAFADPEERKRLRRIFDEAVEETVDQDIEPDMQTRVRIDGADYDRITGNALTVGFDHATARRLSAKEFAKWLAANDKLLPGGTANDNVPDPHWHKHLLVWNATHDPVENRIKAGQLHDIVRDKGYYRAAFYARLADKLEDEGFVIDRRGGNKWEIAGIPQSMIDKFSKRTDQIDAEAEQKGITDAARKAELGAKNRAKKQKELSMPELREAWNAQLTDAERRALAAVYRKEIAPGKEVTAQEAVAYAIDHISEKLSVMPERELKRVALLYGLGHVTPGQIAAELPRAGILVTEIDGRRMATTAALQAEEDYIVGQAAGRMSCVTPVGVAAGLTRRMENGKRLNDGQWDAVCGLLNSQCRTNLVEGPAGAGKSSLLGKLDEGMKRAGQHISYFATTAAAVEVLHKDGFTDTKTVAHLLLDEKLQAKIRGSRIVVDEVSMLGHKDAVRLFHCAEKNGLKLILVGDPMQHGAVSRGAVMRILKDYAYIKPFKLNQILRQENPEYRKAATLLSEGKTLEGFDAIDAMGRIVEMSDAVDRYRHIAADYLQALDDKKSVLVVSPTHAEAKAITAAIRLELRHAGRLGADDHAFTRLVQVDTSEAERLQATTYRPGDVLVFHQNAKGGFTKGDRLTVTDPAAVPLAEAGRFSLYRPEQILLAVDDRIRFTGNVKTVDGEHTLKNGNARSIAAFTSKGIVLDNGWVIPKDAGLFRHGFVETSFGSQGRTVQRVILGMASASIPAMNMEQLYVSASRAKEWIRLYTDSKGEIRDAVQRSSQKLVALDLRPKRQEAKADEWGGAQDHMARRRRWAFFNRLRAERQRQTPEPTLPGKPPTHTDKLKRPERSSGHER